MNQPAARGGRGRGSRGSGRSRGRGNGRGRGEGSTSSATAAPRFGDRIVLSNVEAGFAPPTAPSRSNRPKIVQTGTEEILGNIIEAENDMPLVSPKTISKKTTESAQKVQSKIRSTAAAPKENQKASDDDIEMEDLSETSPDGILTQLQIRPMIIRKKEEAPIDGYKDIWENGQFNKQTRVIGDYEKTSDKVCVVLPIPRAQPLHYLNKFARTQLPLAEPQFRKIKPKPPMTFTSASIHQQFRGTEACSKVAGRVLTEIFEKHHIFKRLFSIQIPNSLRAISNCEANDDDDWNDIEISKQNVAKSEAENVGMVTAKSQAIKISKPKYHCLTQFSSDKPFGKLQILKSGKVVLRIGNRVLNVCMSTRNHDTHVGAIFESESEDKSRPPVSSNSIENQNQQDNMFLLGKVEHFFTAYYDYQKILKEKDCAQSG